MSNYRRTSKPKTEHIKKGFTVFQKTITTIGSILGLITATITIMNALDNNKNTKKEPTTTIVKEIQKESPQENTSPNKENNTSQEKT
ncbi:TBC1 domain family member 8B [Streptococcus pseudopneumoniae]|uniref:TBC1 domain family member 8B n=2 Tax=Streptococcus pseudopneumoniae TaxID=257758 RepID=A0A0T8U6A2_9STRE|nr:TBC1 domain family member 8B [Streptococcus pseudopneumoniae]